MNQSTEKCPNKPGSEECRSCDNDAKMYCLKLLQSEVARLTDLAYVQGARPGLTEREHRQGIIKDFQKLSQQKNALQARVAELEPLLENEKVAARAASKAMSEAQEREDAMRGGTPGPYVHCTTCGRAMVWARTVWMCPVHVHDRMQIAEDRVVELETLETARGQAVSELKARRDQLKADLAAAKEACSTLEKQKQEMQHERDLADDALKLAEADFQRIAAAVLGALEGEASVDDIVNYVKKERLLAVETAEHCGKYKELFELLRQERDGEVWCWQGDGEDHLESLTCPVLIRPEILKAMHDESVMAAIRRGDFKQKDGADA